VKTGTISIKVQQYIIFRRKMVIKRALGHLAFLADTVYRDLLKAFGFEQVNRLIHQLFFCNFHFHTSDLPISYHGMFGLSILSQLFVKV